MRRLIRKVFNQLGYDIHRQVKDVHPLFDMSTSAISAVSLGDTQARFFIADRNDAIQSHHDKGRFYEEDILQLLLAHFSPGECFVDIGANVGNHSIFVAKSLQPSRVIAIEPMRLQHAILVVNVLLNELQSAVEVHKVAASDRGGQARMITPNSQNIGRSMIAEAVYGEWVNVSEGDKIIGERHVDFIKVDVEGHELKALAGLERTISRCRPKMLVEVAVDNESSFEKWLIEHGYSIVLRVKHHEENCDFLVAPTFGDSVSTA